MKREEANTILYKMSTFLDNNQMMKLQKILDEIVSNEELSEPMKSSSELLESFIATKRLEGGAEKTLALYSFTIGKLITAFDKNVCVLTTEDIRG